ncbi:MAG: trimethylamine methyltransferase family protein [Spirochaetota bacterium]
MTNEKAIKTAHLACELSLDHLTCDQVLEASITLLDEHGLSLSSERTRKFFSSIPGVHFHSERVCFKKAMVYDYLEKMRAQAGPVEPAASFSLGEPWSCLNWVDLQKGVIRGANEEDLIRAVRFLDSYGVEGFVPPVVLSSLPPALRDLHGTRICMENSSQYGAPTHTPGEKELALYKQMAHVVQHKVWILAMLIISPMRFDSAVCEFVLDHILDKELSIEMTAGMPCTGSTAPLIFPAAYVQSLAEALAATLFIHAITHEYPFPYLRSDPFDMQYGNYCVGSPEYSLLDLGSRRIFQHLTGRPREWGYLLSMSKWPDQQAAHERTVSCWLQALSGAVHFKGAGQLSSDEVFSLEQVVIDRTIMQGAERVMRGLKWETSPDRSYQVLKEGFARGSFLDHDSTLEEYVNFYSDRELFPAMNLNQWNSRNKPTPLSMAGEIIGKNLARNTFQRDELEIRELRKICEYGKKLEGFYGFPGSPLL